MVRHTIRKTAIAPTVLSSPRIANSPSATTPARTPSRIQPIRSLAMPPATMTCPMLRRIRPMSIRIFATTGREEMDSATAMNKANGSRRSAPPRKMSGMRLPRT